MAFAQYSEAFWFPNGALAAGVAARIFPLQSNALAPIFTDVTGTVPLPNPLSTDVAGVLTFWAEEGEYWLHLDTESFRIQVGTPNTLDTFDAGSVAVSTGVVSGGRLSLSATPLAVDISETVGYVVDYATDDFRPAIARVHTPAQTVLLDAAALLRTATFWLIDSSGAVTQQATPPTPTQRRTHIELGFSALLGGAVTLVQSTATLLPQPANQVVDLLKALGPFSIGGNALSPNGANLSINKSAGTMFSHSFKYATAPDDPHTAVLPAQTPTQVRYALRNTTAFPVPGTLLDPANYDLNGALAPVGGGAQTSTVQRVFLFAVDNVADQVAIQYGQNTYASLAAATASIGSTNYVVNPLFIATLIGWIVMTRTATNLSDPAQAVFVRPTSRFPIP